METPLIEVECLIDGNLVVVAAPAAVHSQIRDQLADAVQDPEPLIPPDMEATLRAFFTEKGWTRALAALDAGKAVRDES